MGVGPNGAVARAEDYANRIIDRLDRIVERTEQRVVRDQMRWERRSDRNTSNPHDFTISVPLGVYWEIKKLIVQGAAGGVDTVSLYLNEVAPQNRVEYSILDTNGIAVRGSSDWLAYAPPGSKLILQVTSAIGTTLSFSMLIREIVTEE